MYEYENLNAYFALNFVCYWVTNNIEYQNKEYTLFLNLRSQEPLDASRTTFG